MITKEEVAEILLTLKGNLTNKEIAEKSGLNESVIGHWLKAKSAIKLEDFAKYCEFFGVEMSDALNKNKEKLAIPIKVEATLMAIRQELISIWKQVEDGKDESKLMQIFLNHIRQTKETLVYIKKEDDFPEYFKKEHKLNLIAEQPTDYKDQ